MTKHILLFVLFSAAQFACAQKEYYKWYFGNSAAIDFVPGSPTALTNSVMPSTDNPATMSDSAGNLLFYSNGLRVWNRNHAVMANGNGLLGSNSGGHTATAVRKPGSTSLYYLFTMDAYGAANGLRYDVIDMNLNGGLGDIVAGQKNLVIIASASEQIVPVLHSNGTDIWIVTHPWNSSSYNSYLLSASGLNITPVVSAVGISRSGNTDNALGQINVNAANNKIVSVCWGSNHFELLDFNNTTGALSNPLLFPNYNNAWGAEDRKSTRLNSSHGGISRMPSSA